MKPHPFEREECAYSLHKEESDASSALCETQSAASVVVVSFSFVISI